MAVNLGELFVTIGGRTGNLRQSQREVISILSGIDSRMKRTEAAAANMGNVMRQAFGGLTTGLAAREVVQMADAYNLLNSRLALVTESASEQASVMNRLQQIAQSTRQSLEGTATIFTRVAQGRKELGRSTAEILAFVEQINKLVVISGAAPQEAQAAIIQLSQGLASGTLRGEELRSVLEQLPAVARKIAEGIGIPFGKLREEAQEGKLTSKAVFDAIIKGSQETNAAFDKMGTTVGQAWTMFKNSMMVAVGEAEKSTGAIRHLSDAIVFLSKNLGYAEAFVRAFVLGVTGMGTGIEGAVLKLRIWAKEAGNFLKMGGATANDIRQLEDFKKALEEFKTLSHEDIDSQVRALDALMRKIEELNAPKKNLIRLIPVRKKGADSPAEEEAEKIKKVTKARKELTEAEKAHIELRRQQADAEEAAVQEYERVNQSADEYAGTLRREIEIMKAKLGGDEKHARLLEIQSDLIDRFNGAEYEKIQALTQERLRLDQLTTDYELQRATLESIDDEEKKVSESARDLTQAIGTAFEDAVIEGKGFREVLKGILDDINRIILRAAITKPLEGYISAAISGFSPFGGFGGGPFDQYGAINDIPGIMGPAAAAMAAGGNTQVNVINTTGAPVQTSESIGPGGQQITDIMIGQMEQSLSPSGRTGRKMQAWYGLRPGTVG